MALLLSRRALLAGAVSLPWMPGRARAGQAAGRLEALERDSGVRLGVAAFDSLSGKRLDHGADDRFALCSTFKVLLAAAVLRRGDSEAGVLDRRLTYGAADMVSYSPVTAGRGGDGMTVADLCAAALRHSDNTAANLLLRLVGGPAALTAYVRSLGDSDFRLDRWETALNTAEPGDPRDTTTPRAMAADLFRLMLGDGLAEGAREQLVGWMRGNTTGGRRIRAGLPDGWVVADKTGSGDWGTANDVGVVWPPGRPPLVLAIFTAGPARDAPRRDDVVAAAARIVAETLG